MQDPSNPFDDRAAGLAMLGTIFFFAISGLGVGAFVEEPAIGGLAGGVIGIVVGFWLVPRLMRDWQ